MLGIMQISGFASPSGTERFRQRHAGIPSDHFRDFDRLQLSSIGLGTYLGDPDEATDHLYAEAIETAIGLGCNVLDAAINYRCQRSERVIGEALKQLFARGDLKREEIFICTKGGYLPFDGEVPEDPGRYLIDTVLNPGLASYDDIIGGCHCLSPAYIDHALQMSRRNLGLETIDAYYLHNPEQQLDVIDPPIFLKRMESAFALLEERAKENQIRCFGIATWNGLRVSQKNKNYISLEMFVQLARQVGGTHHHFRIIQLPYNLAMPEAFSFANQIVEGKPVTVLEASRRLGLSCICSGSLLQSRLSALPGSLAERIPDMDTAAQRALQFVRSTPGVMAALVGMKQKNHVKENMALAQKPLLSEEAIGALFNRTANR